MAKKKSGEKAKFGSKELSESELAKKYAGSGLASKITVVPDSQIWLPSRSLYLNYTMGGGIPYGKIVEIFGGESSGKSLAAADFGSCAQYLGGIVLWNDAEQSFDPHWAELNGLDLEKVVLYNETSIERISDWSADMAIYYRRRLVNNEPIIIITDSIAALDCEANINSVQSDDKAEMGNRAKALYKMLRIRNQMYSELGVIYIFINQLRKKVGATMFEDPDTTPGGDAMKFFASQRMAFFRKKKLEDELNGHDVWIGNEVSIRLKKNKVAPPRPTFTTEVYFNEQYGKVGFSRYHNLVELFERTEVVDRKKGSSRFYYKGKELANGADNFQKLLEEDQELRSKLLRRANINTLSTTKQLLDSLKEQGINRYKV